MTKLMVRWAAVGAACCGMLMAQSPAQAAGPMAAGEKPVAGKPVVGKSVAGKSAAEKPVVTDVALTAGGTLSGKVVDANGLGVDGAAVAVHQGERTIAQAVADERGAFTVRGLRGGTYQITGGQGQGVYRLWAENTAPPAARPQALLVSSPEAVRGQVSPIDTNTTLLVTTTALSGVAAGFAIESADDSDQAKDAARQASQIAQQNQPGSPN